MGKTNIRLVSWNIRAGGGVRIEGIFSQLLRWKPTIIGLCEFRGTPPSCWLQKSLASAGYEHQISTVDSRDLSKNALLLASKIPLRKMHLSRMPRLNQRWILARTRSTPKLVIGLLHVPNYTSPELKYPFLDAVQDMCANWRSGTGIVMGDTNCGKRGIDEENTFFGPFRRENDFMDEMQKQGWHDSFRYLHGDRREYTWYSHRNNGFRLDQAFCNSGMIDYLDSFSHEWGGRDSTEVPSRNLSDHAALLLDFSIRSNN